MSQFSLGGRSKLVVVLVGAIALSVLGIQASDTLRGLNTNLSGLVTESEGPCASGEVQFLLGSHSLCIDVYEASAGVDCPHLDPRNQTDTQHNLNDAACITQTEADAQPWRFVSLTQAQQLCARSGKRLPTSAEWYKFASGLTDEGVCVLEGRNSPAPTGIAGCVTPAGVHDVVGNVWEWVEATIRDGTYQDRSVPPSGYVSLVDSDGVVIETETSPQAEFGADYAWTKNTDTLGMIRGGFYGSASDGGIFAQNLSIPLDFKTAGVGFRCVRDI